MTRGAAVFLSFALSAWTAEAFPQSSLAGQLADLTAQKGKMGNAETRVRVDALHRVWTIAVASPHSDVRLEALALLEEPAGSSSDHIRMPAVYAIAEIATGTDDAQVKIRALRALAEPLRAGQVPIRDVAIDAINSITRSARDSEVALGAVQALAEPVRSGNNGVRIPAINALVRAVEGKGSDRACQAALDLLAAPLNSGSMIGGMEVRMMAVRAVERVGLEATEVGTKEGDGHAAVVCDEGRLGTRGQAPRAGSRHRCPGQRQTIGPGLTRTSGAGVGERASRRVPSPEDQGVFFIGSFSQGDQETREEFSLPDLLISL